MLVVHKKESFLVLAVHKKEGFLVLAVHEMESCRAKVVNKSMEISVAKANR